MQRVLRWSLIVTALALMCGSATSAHAYGTLGGFEVDGNLIDDSGAGDPIDWASPPPGLTPIPDGSGKNDDIFGLGSKELEPAGWSCVSQSAPPKDDIVGGQVAFRKVGTDTFMYGSYFRKAVTGDAHVDYELNKSSQPANATCPFVPMRSSGDALVSFDTLNGGQTVEVHLFEWAGDANIGTFVEIPVGANADGAVNIPPAGKSIPGHKDGDFGEVAINLTQTIGPVACGTFAGVYIKSRSSTELSAALKDFTKQKRISSDNCPSSDLAKSVRNVTAGGAFATTAAAKPGDVLEYQLVYKNLGSGAATNVDIVDTIQARQTYVSCSQTPPCTTAGTPIDQVKWHFASVAAGATQTVTFRTVLDSAFPTGETPVKNQGSVTTQQEGTKTSNETTVTVAAAPESGLAKAVRNVTSDTSFASSTDANPGDSIEYRLTYTNSGNAAATNVVVSDPIPAKTTFVSCTEPCTKTGTPVNSVSWTFASVAPGESKIVFFTVKLDQTGWTAGTSTPVTNTAKACTDEEGASCTNSPPTVVNVKSPDSSLAKAVRTLPTTTFTSSTTAAPGDTVEYRLTYTNGGPGTATDVVISDPIPTRTTFISCTEPCTKTGTPVTAVSWTFPSVAPGETQVVTFQVKLDPAFAAGTTTITNVGTVCTAEEPCENSPPATVTVTTAPESGLAKAVRNVTSDTSFASSTDANPGDSIEYRLTYTNSGNAAATNVVVSDPIPAKTTFVSCTEPCTKTGTPVNSVSWTFASVAPGESKIVFFTVKLDQTGWTAGTSTPVTNTAKACTDEEGASCTNSPPTVVNVKSPDSSLAKAVRTLPTTTFTSSTTAAPGDTVEYRLTYTNGGPGTATDVVISDPIPTRTTFISCTEPCTKTGTPVTAVSWTFPSVAPGETQVVTFQVKLDPAFPSGTTTITNVGTVCTAEEPCENSPPATVTVTARPDLDLDKSSDSTGIVEGGQLVTYTLDYSNNGQAVAVDTSVTEPIPAGTEFVSCTEPCTKTGTPISSVSWNVGDLDPGESGTLKLAVRVLSTAGCRICNIARIASVSQDNGTPESSNEVCLDAAPSPNPDGAKASGSAMGASVKAELPLVGVIDEQLSQTSSTQSGVGQDTHEAFLGLDPIPNPIEIDGLLYADVMRTTSTSTVTREPAQARDVSTARTVGVSVLDGLVTADVVQAVSESVATGDSSRISSVGSTFKNLKVNGVAMNDVGPNTTIALGDVTGVGLGVKVALREEIGGTSGPSANTLQGGTYRADLKVNMIHVHVLDGNLVQGGKQPIDIIVSQAASHADFPQTRLCKVNPERSVSGHAFLASENTSLTDPELLPITVNYVDIPSLGGFASKQLAQAFVPDDGSVVTATAVNSQSEGSTALASQSTSRSIAEAANVCIKLTGPSCDIAAEAVRSQSNSLANSLGANSNADGSYLVNLTIAGINVPIAPPPNTVIGIPGVAEIILNEQVRDATAAGHTGLTVRAIRVILLDPPDDAPAAAEVIVAEAHSDALWKP